VQYRLGSSPASRRSDAGFPCDDVTVAVVTDDDVTDVDVVADAVDECLSSCSFISLMYDSYLYKQTY